MKIHQAAIGGIVGLAGLGALLITIGGALHHFKVLGAGFGLGIGSVGLGALKKYHDWRADPERLSEQKFKVEKQIQSEKLNQVSEKQKKLREKGTSTLISDLFF